MNYKNNAKRFKGIGGGVFEIRCDFDTNTYRSVVAVQLGERIYVLHAFMKKSKKGISTPKRDVKLIKKRYKEVKEAIRNEKEKTD